MKSKLLALLIFLPFVPTGSADASSIALRLGRFSPRIESALWSDNLQDFAIERRDFDGFIGGAEFAVELSEFVDFTVGVEGSSRTVFSNYRDFVRDDGSEIIQDLRLQIVPVTAGVRFYPAGKFHVLVPYVDGGAGFYYIEYTEEGEFIDFETFDVFVDFFVDHGMAYGLYVSGGLELRVTRAVSLFGEYRRHWAHGEHRDDFAGFGDFDLDADQVSFGVNFRF